MMHASEAFTSGKVAGLGLPDRVVTPHISKIFIFGARVFKHYNHQKYFFADLTNSDERTEFITEDFFWNNAAAPEVYRHLWGLKQDAGGEGFSLVPHTEGEDWVIEMSLIDDSLTLTKLLSGGLLKLEHVRPFISTIVDTLATLTIERRNKLSFLYEKPLNQIVKEDIENLYVWMLDTAPRIPKEHSERLKSVLFKAIDVEPYFKNAGKEQYRAAIDANSDNLLWLDGSPSMIDIMPPRVSWRIVDEYATVSRTIVDIEVLGTSALAEIARASYASFGRELPPTAKLVYEVRAAGIQWAYRHMLNQEELAEKFGIYTLKKLAELEARL